MTHELRGLGKDGPRLRFDRTQVVLDQEAHRQVIPLDQIVQVRRGQESAPPGYLALPIIGLAVAVWGYLWGPPADGSLWWVYLGLGVALALLGIVAMFLLNAHVVRIESSRGEMMLNIRKDQMREAAMFVRDLMHARTEFLEGVYEAEEP